MSNIPVSSTHTPVSPDHPAAGKLEPQLINTDPPRHTQLRKLMNPPFKPGALRDTEGETRQVVRDVLGAVEGKTECDFVNGIKRMPMRLS